VVHRQWYENGVHPARLTLGEPIFGVIQWPIQGRVSVGRAGLRPYIELFASVQEAKLLAEQHRIEYKVYRPRSGYRLLSVNSTFTFEQL